MFDVRLTKSYEPRLRRVGYGNHRPLLNRHRKALGKLFPPEYLDARARAHQVIVRRRKVDAAALLWALVFGFAIGEGRTIEDIRRTYVGFAAKFLRPSSFHDRLTEELVALLRELIEDAMAELPTPHTMTDSVDRFRVIFIADATILRLNDLLVEKFPATHPDLAEAKLHVIHNITDATIDHLDITDERTHNSTSFKTGKWLQGRLILLDLAYFKYHRFARIDENDGYFVSLVKRSTNPEIVAELRSWRGRSRPLFDKKVWDAVVRLTRHEIDVLMEVTFKGRPYRGTR